MWVAARRLLQKAPAVSSALTESTATKQPSTKNVRRPEKIWRQMLVDRLRKRRQARAKLIAAKEEAQRQTMLGSPSEVDARDLVMAQLADQIFSRGHKHVCCATNISFVPDGNPAMPEVALAGRSGVGKSALLRSLFRSSREVSRSNTKLRRDAMNFFSVGGGVFNIVDLPGVGGTSVPWSTVLQHAVLLRNFVRCRPSLKMLYYCLDVHYKHGVYIQDFDILRFLTKEVPNFTIVLTKSDQLDTTNSDTVMRIEDIRQELIFHDITHPVLVTSAYHMGGIDTLRFDMTMNCLHAIPTERLTIAEAKHLSERLLSQRELSTVRYLSLPPTQLDDDLRAWNAELKRERAGDNPNIAEDSVKSENTDNGSDEPSTTSTTTTALKTTTTALIESTEVADISTDAVKAERNVAFKSLQKKISNQGLMQYVHQTSPWRNPLLWPSNVVPTKHPKANIMRCPEDPHNPYLIQAHFVCPRADMYFRRPNIGTRRAAGKGKYEADRPLAFLLRPYTIPYFPDIVDTKMHPLPWTFLGSREAYFEKDGGRQLGVRLTHYATDGEVRPLSENPAPFQPDLTKELRELERKRYGEPIAMLRPPEKSLEGEVTKESVSRTLGR